METLNYTIKKQQQQNNCFVIIRDIITTEDNDVKPSLLFWIFGDFISLWGVTLN